MLPPAGALLAPFGCVADSVTFSFFCCLVADSISFSVDFGLSLVGVVLPPVCFVPPVLSPVPPEIVLVSLTTVSSVKDLLHL